MLTNYEELKVSLSLSDCSGQHREDTQLSVAGSKCGRTVAVILSSSL